MNLYIMRHGTTVWNEKGITQGRTNNRLSKKGKELTYSVSEKCKDVEFNVIFCSPLMRTVQTANIINKYHNVKIIKDMNLIEIDQGIFSGRHKDDLTEEERVLKLNRSKKCNMESYKEALSRAKKFVEYVKCNYKEGNILIVTHNCIATFIENLALNINIDLNNDKHLRNFDNAQIKKITLCD